MPSDNEPFLEPMLTGPMQWCMMTSSIGNIFHFIGPRFINNRDAGDLRRHCAHYGVNVIGQWMSALLLLQLLLLKLLSLPLPLLLKELGDDTRLLSVSFSFPALPVTKCGHIAKEFRELRTWCRSVERNFTNRSLNGRSTQVVSPDRENTWFCKDRVRQIAKVMPFW